MIRQGGTYIRKSDGSLEQVAEPTKDHPRRNAPRDAEGKPLDRLDDPFSPAAASSSEGKPAEAPRGPKRAKAAASAEPAADAASADTSAEQAKES